MNIDLSTEALLARRAIAEKAMPGAFNGENDYYIWEQRAGMEHNCANYPQVVMADIDEILRLRSLVQEHEEYIANLELEAASTDNKIDGLALLLGIRPDTGNRRIIGIIKDEILRLRNELAATECREGEGDAYVEQLCLERDDLEAQVEQLEREADWLASNVREGECPPFPWNHLNDSLYCDVSVSERDCASCWREAARKAVEKKA